MSGTFLRLELAGRNSTLQTNDTILVNTDHIVRIHPTWPQGCTIVTTDDASLNVTASLDELQKRLSMTGGRTHVVKLEHEVDVTREDRILDHVLNDGAPS